MVKTTTINKKFVNGWKMEASIYPFEKKQFAYIKLTNRKDKKELNFNTLHNVGSQKLEELVRELCGFEVMEQVVEKYN